jgi:hypothetical protein
VSPRPPRTLDLPLGDRARLRASEADDGSCRLRFQGDLRLGWLGTLSRKLAESALDILTLEAERNERGDWLAEFVVRSTAGRVDPLSLDYERIVDESETSNPLRGEARILRATLARDSDDMLVLHVIAPDELGFLSRILGRLGFLGAFPERIRAQSEGANVVDTFWLRGFGRAPLTDASEQALRAAFVVPSSRPPIPSGPPKAP